MSKTTARLGKPLYIARLSSEWPATPSPRLKRQWVRQDETARKLYGKQYDALTDAEKINVHYTLNLARAEDRRKAEAATKEAAAA